MDSTLLPIATPINATVVSMDAESNRSVITNDNQPEIDVGDIVAMKAKGSPYHGELGKVMQIVEGRSEEWRKIKFPNYVDLKTLKLTSLWSLSPLHRAIALLEDLLERADSSFSDCQRSFAVEAIDLIQGHLETY